MFRSFFSCIRFGFRWIRRSILLIGCIFFFATSVLTLTSGLVQSVLSASLAAFGITSVYSALESTIRRKNSTIRKQKVANRKLNANLKEASKGKHQLLDKNSKLTRDLETERTNSRKHKDALEKERSRSKGLNEDIQKEKAKANRLSKKNEVLAKNNAKANSIIRSQKAAVKSIGGRVTRRTLRSAALNIGSIPFESAPFIGAGVVVVVTGYELHMACDSIDDMNEIYITMGIEPDVDPGFAERTCVGYIGKVNDLVDTANETFNMKRVNKIVDDLLSESDIDDNVDRPNGAFDAEQVNKIVDDLISESKTKNNNDS